MAVGPTKASDLKVQIVEAETAENIKHELKKLLDYLADSNCEVYSIQYQVDNGKYSFALVYSFAK
jgi:hypothetical protein